MMNNNEIELPALPSEEPEELVIYQKIMAYLLDMAVDYPEPRYLLEYQGVGFAPLGGIQAVSGQKKNGKTFLLTQFMSAILGDGSERLEAKLPGLKVRQETLEAIDKQPTVLYVDTEMEQLNTVKVARRVHWLCGWDTKQNCDRLRVLWLRTVEDPDEKRRIVMDAIQCFKPTAVFIDGIRDLVKNFNDIDLSMPVVSQLMKCATENNCCIWNVLHMNPRPSNDDESKMRGHLGTELGNKVTDTFTSMKKKEGDKVVFTVKQLDARGKDVPDWKFEITDDAGELGIPRIIGEVAEEPKVKADDIDQIKQWIQDGQHTIEWPATLSEIREMFKRFGVTYNDRLQADIRAAINRGFIRKQDKSEMTKGQTHPKYKIDEDLILPL